MKILSGLAIGFSLALMGFYFLVMAGVVTIIGSDGNWLVLLFNLARENLGYSIPPFLLTLAMFIFYLWRLSDLTGNPGAIEKALDEGTYDGVSEVIDVEAKVDLAINLFFGIGVIFTAIGMRNSLLVALGGLDAETAASKGAWYILRQLVDGGILLALSTTIVGGIGGYMMKMAKSWCVGQKLETYYAIVDEQKDRRSIELLEQIVALLSQSQRRL